MPVASYCFLTSVSGLGYCSIILMVLVRIWGDEPLRPVCGVPPTAGLPAPSTGVCRPVRRGSADPFSLKTVHWTVFRAFEPLKTLHRRVFRALDAPERITTVNLATALPKAFPSRRSLRFRGRLLEEALLKAG